MNSAVTVWAMSLKRLFFCLSDVNEPVSINLWPEQLNCVSEVLHHYESTQRVAWPNHAAVELLEDEGSFADNIPQTAWKKITIFWNVLPVSSPMSSNSFFVWWNRNFFRFAPHSCPFVHFPKNTWTHNPREREGAQQSNAAVYPVHWFSWQFSLRIKTSQSHYSFIKSIQMHVYCRYLNCSVSSGRNWKW